MQQNMGLLDCAAVKEKTAVACKQKILLTPNSQGKQGFTSSIYDTWEPPIRQKWDGNFALWQLFLRGLPDYCLSFICSYFFFVAINVFLNQLLNDKHDLSHHSCPNPAPCKLMRIFPVNETSICHWDYTSDWQPFIMWNRKVYFFHIIYSIHICK